MAKRWIAILTLILLLFPQGNAFAKTQIAKSIFKEKIEKRSARISWVVDPYTQETDSWLLIRKQDNTKWKKITQRSARKVQGGNYETTAKQLKPATNYEFAIEIQENKDAMPTQSPIYSFFTNPHVKFDLRQESALIQWKMPRQKRNDQYQGYVRYRETNIQYDTPWLEALPKRPYSQFVGAVLAPLKPNTGYQYQIQLRTKNGYIVYTSEPETFKTK